MKLTKTHKQILNIVNIKEYFKKECLFEKFIEKLNKAMPYGYKQSDLSLSLFKLSELNDYAVDKIHGLCLDMYKKCKKEGEN